MLDQRNNSLLAVLLLVVAGLAHIFPVTSSTILGIGAGIVTIQLVIGVLAVLTGILLLLHINK